MALLPSAVMNIASSEWIIIILIALVLLFGTKKLPQLSRSIGRAMGEYEKAKETFRREMEEASSGASDATRIPKITGPVSTEREKLERLAESLGIDDYQGLTNDELRRIISKRIAS